MVLGFVIDYAWISRLLRDAAFTWRARELSCWLKKWLISGNLAIWTVYVLEKVLFLKCFRGRGEINSHVCSKTQWQMFLLVPCRHPDGYQHGFSMKIPINLGKKFLRIFCAWILAKVFVYLPSFFSRFWTLSIELFWFILHEVTLKIWPHYKKTKTNIILHVATLLQPVLMPFLNTMLTLVPSSRSPGKRLLAQ